MTDAGRRKLGMASYAVYRWARKLSRLPILRAMIPFALRERMQHSLSPNAINQFPDRRYMEAELLPAVVALAPQRVLDVGVESYTAHYGRWFPESCERWTLDMNPNVVPFGAPGRHVLGDARHMDGHFEPASMDVVMVNGTFGYGTDNVQDQEQTVQAARRLLKSHGWLLLGWDRALDGTPLVFADRGRNGAILEPTQLDEVRQHFSHEGLPGLPPRKEFAESSHVYDWFRKRS
ncbi:MAG: class I SAM-dependent methyltransferase [Pseudomonadota bacterium]